MSALLIALTLASAQPGPEPYRAHGSGPSWSLVIDAGRLRYEPADGPVVEAAVPDPFRYEEVREYRTDRLTATVLEGATCSDEASDDRYADTVRIQMDRRELRGCGGPILAADDLTGTRWHFVQIADEAVPLTGDLLRDDVYAIDFYAEGFVGYGGCNRFSAAYSRNGGTLTTHAPWGTGRRRCAAPVMAREQRLMQILLAPISVSFPDANTLVLTGQGGTIRLRRTPDQ